jgi:hypothetical protein
VHSVHCSFKLFAAAVKKAAAAAAAAAAQAERQQQWQLHRTAAMKARSSQDQLQELVVVYTCSCATFIALNMNKICYCSRTPPIARVHHLLLAYTTLTRQRAWGEIWVERNFCCCEQQRDSVMQIVSNCFKYLNGSDSHREIHLKQGANVVLERLRGGVVPLWR